jgi:hypothetical protein
MDLYQPPADGLDQFRYSPLVAGALVPFTMLPLTLGGVVWRLLNAGVYLSAFCWCCQTIFPIQVNSAQRGVLLLLVIPLSVGSVNNGQSNPLVIGLMLATVACAATGRWNGASVCLALACLLKVYPLALGLLLAALYPRQFILRFALALGAGLALPFLFQDPAYVSRQYRAWFWLLGSDDRSNWPLSNCYRDLWLLCRLVHLPLSRLAYLLIQLASGGGILVLCLVGRRAGWSSRQVLISTLSLATCWMTLLGPATESSTYILVAPALAWAVADAFVGHRSVPVCSLLLTSYGLFTVAAVACWFPGGTILHTWGAQPLATLLLLSALVASYLSQILRAAWRRRQASETCPAGAL